MAKATEIAARREDAPPVEPLVPVEEYENEPAARNGGARGGSGLPDEPPPISPLTLRALTPDEILKPIKPESFLLPGVPVAAYTLIAGALSSYKTTLLMYLLTWKASGCDVLGLDADGHGVAPGKAVLLSYEDTDERVCGKLRRVIQHGYGLIHTQHGERAAHEYIERIAANFRRITLAGEAGAGIVCRSEYNVVVRNDVFLARLVPALKAFAPEGALMGLDPLRLAIVGSQNDDDGADIAVHAMNYLASALPNSALIASSHTTKNAAQEGVGDYLSAAYATSGSALYSQHARSNFHMGRLKDTEIRALFDPKDVTEEETAKQHVAKLIHGRNSHGAERDALYLLMRLGTLTRLKPRESKTVAQVMAEAARPIIGAIDHLRESGMRASITALESDAGLLGKLGGRSKVREAINLLTENGHLQITGKTRDRTIAITDVGRSFAGGNRRESENGATR
jgi:AAA domain